MDRGPTRRIDRVRARVALIGADPHDDDDTRADKALLVLISLLILPIALLWGVLYLSFGSLVGWRRSPTSSCCSAPSLSSPARVTSASSCA